MFFSFYSILFNKSEVFLILGTSKISSEESINVILFYFKVLKLKEIINLKIQMEINFVYIKFLFLL